MIRSFLETAVNTKFICKNYHNALYRFHIEDETSITDPGITPYFNLKFFTLIKEIKSESSADIRSLSSAELYDILLKKLVTEETNEDGMRVSKITRIEKLAPEMKPARTGMIMSLKGLKGEQTSFLMKMMFNILPTRTRLHKLNLTDSPACDLCNTGASGDLTHSLTECSFNGAVNDWTLGVLIDLDPSLVNADLCGTNLITFNLPLERDSMFPVVWFLVNIFKHIWASRCSRKQLTVSTTKENIEAEIWILKNTHFLQIAEHIETAINFISY